MASKIEAPSGETNMSNVMSMDDYISEVVPVPEGLQKKETNAAPAAAEGEVADPAQVQVEETNVDQGIKMGTRKSHHISLEQELLDNLAHEDRKILLEIDGDQSGIVELAEVLALIRSYKETKGNTAKLFFAFFVVVFGLVILLGGNTIATFVVVEGAKENKVTGSDLVSAKTGKTVETASSDMTVDADGKLVTKATARRLDGKGGAIKTSPTLEKVTLASSLPDKVLMGLDEITVYSDKGHTLQIKVNGFSRVPVLNSHCGNVVHFYTAWKGRITLDSTHLSFDEATAKQFKNAGFTVGVGGMGGRKLAGTSSTDGFFKHMDGLKDKAGWKCAGVPLPTMSETNIRKESRYQPCGTKGHAADKVQKDMCDSKYGGLVPGAGLLPAAHAYAVVSKTKRISALLKQSAPEVIYVKMEATSMRSAGYQVSISKYANHVGQELISITDLKTSKGVEFQNVAKKGRSHCTATGSDAAIKTLNGAKKDANPDMHFEFLGTQEEDGKVLRHFRMMTSDAFTKFMGGGSRPTDSYTEYWDVADTLTPYRILSGDGSLTVFESLVAKCSDAEVEAAIKASTNKAIKDLMACSADDSKDKNRPKMQSPYDDLDKNAKGYYTENVFGSEDDQMALAKDVGNMNSTADLARYLTKTSEQLAMPDFCRKHCEQAMEKLKIDLQNGADTCATKSLPNALQCMDNSGMSQCMQSEFVANHQIECGNNLAPVRRMEEDMTETEDDDDSSDAAVIAVKYMGNGTHQAAVKDFSSSVQDILAARIGEDAAATARFVFNGTKMSSSPVELVRKRGLMTTSCNSKAGRTTWMGDGWCMKWEFKRYGFELVIKWGYISGAIGLSITCQACVPILLVWAIPPPLKVDKCVGGSISVTAVRSCPQIPLTISGNVYMSIEGKADFGVIEISFAKLEIGIQASIAEQTFETHCWWISGEGRRRRRRWWSRRRRNVRRCNYRKDCDLKVGAYAQFTFTVFRVQIDFDYWVKNKTITITITIYCYQVWLAFFGGWQSMYSTIVARYRF